MKNKLLLALLALSIAFTACKKNDDGDEPTAEDPFKLDYSNLTVEQHKKELEKTGMDFMKKINTMPDEKFIKVMRNLNDLNLELTSNSVKKMNSFADAASNKSVSKILSSATSTDTEKLSDSYGIYTYSLGTKSWKKTPASDRLEINFPAYKTSTTNNAKITMTYVSSKINATIDESILELPKSSSATLLVDGLQEMKFTSAHEYKPDGTPTKTDMNLKMGSFTMAFNVANTTEVLTNSFTFSKGTETLFSFNSTVNGTLNLGVIDDNELNANDIKNANASFEIMNIKFLGALDIKAINDAHNGSEDLSGKQQNDKTVAALNAHSQFVAINKTSNTIIAKTNFFATESQRCYNNLIWNNSTQSYIYVNECDTSYDWEPRMIFKDGSKLSFDAFKENGFSKLIDDINAFDDRF